MTYNATGDKVVDSTGDPYANDFCQWCYDRGLRYSSGPWRHSVNCPHAPKACDAAPKYWKCTLSKGHQGECAVIPCSGEESAIAFLREENEQLRSALESALGSNKRLPDPPKPKTQEELDEEAENRALVNFMRVNQRDLSEEERYLFFQGHKDGVAYARKGGA